MLLGGLTGRLHSAYLEIIGHIVVVASGLVKEWFGLVAGWRLGVLRFVQAVALRRRGVLGVRCHGGDVCDGDGQRTGRTRCTSGSRW